MPKIAKRERNIWNPVLFWSKEVIEGTWDHRLTPYPALRKSLKGTVAGWLFSPKSKVEEASSYDGWGSHHRQVLWPLQLLTSSQLLQKVLCSVAKRARFRNI